MSRQQYHSTKNSMFRLSDVEPGSLLERSESGLLNRMRKSVNSNSRRFSTVVVSSWVVFMDREVEGYDASLTKSRWGFVSGILSTFLMSIVYIIFFTHFENSVFGGPIGRGDDFFRLFLNNVDDIFQLIFIATAGGLWLFIFLFDAQMWEGCWVYWKYFVFSMASLATLGALLFLSGSVLFAPFFVYILVFIGSLVFVKKALFSNVHKLIYIQSIIIGALFSCAVMLFLFLHSIALGSSYEGTTEVLYHQLLECPELPNFTFNDLLTNESIFEDFQNSNELLIECEEALLVWSTPLIFICATVALTGVLWVLYRAERRRIETRKRVGLEFIEQLFIYFLVISSITLWFAISLANATTAIDSTIFSIVGTIYFTMILTAVTVFKIKYIKSQFKNSAVGKKILIFAYSDWGKGAVILVGTPFVIFFLFFDFIKQLIRKYSPASQYYSITYRDTIFTKYNSRRVKKFFKWNFGAVIPKAHLLSLLAFFLLVGVSKFVILLFSAIRTGLLNHSFLNATLAIMALQYVFHLAPLGRSPVVPSYILSGLCLPSVAEETETMTYGAALGFCILECMFVKMTSRAVQYWAGLRFGHRLRLKLVTKMNSPQMKGAHIVLTSKGNTIKKIVLLGGAPDFAMGVFTGMKKHDFARTLLLSFPSIVRVAPCVLLGAVFVKAGLEPDSNLFAFLSVVTIIGVCGALFVPVIWQGQIKNNAAAEFKEIIDNQVIDDDLLKAEEKKEKIQAKFEEITHWNELNCFIKMLHAVSVIILSLTQYLFQFLESTLFVTFDVTDNIADELSGDPFKIVTLEGWPVLGAFMGSVLYMLIFKKIMKKKAKKLVEAEQPSI